MKYQLIEPRIPQEGLSAVERVLTNRGIKLENIKHYLNTTDEDILRPELIARIVDGVLVITAIFAYNDSDERWEALIEETWWDDQIVIPRAMLGNAEINGNTLVRVELEIKHCIYEPQELIQDACE